MVFASPIFLLLFLPLVLATYAIVPMRGRNPVLLIAGPIIRWRDFTDQISRRDWRAADVAYGIRRFLLGLGKKVLIANTLGRVADAVFDLPKAQLTTPLAWLGLVCYTLQIYFDFS